MRTNTNRIQKNRSTACTSPQIKTPRNHQPENSRIVLKDEAAPVNVLIPSQVAKAADSALVEMERIGNSAVAFVMMNGYVIKASSGANAEWEELDAPGFSDGALEYSRMVSFDFQNVLGELTTAFRKAIEKVRDVHTPVEKETRTKNSGDIKSFDPVDAWHRIENVVGALSHCIELQSWSLCCNGDGTAQAGCFHMKRNLTAAYKAIAQASLDLLDSFCAVTAAERKVVAS